MSKGPISTWKSTEYWSRKCKIKYNKILLHSVKSDNDSKRLSVPSIWIFTYYLVVCLLFSFYVMSDFFVTPCNVAHKAPLSLGFARQEYWSGLLFPSPGDLPNPEMEPISPALAGRLFTAEHKGSPRWVQAPYWCRYFIKLLVLVWESCEHPCFVTQQFTPS